MRRTLGYLSTALVFFALIIVFSASSTRNVKADPKDKCLDCLEKVQIAYEKCVARYGEINSPCGEEFNQGIIHCYAHWCEQ